MTTGYLAIVLHSHLPYVLSHGRWPHGTDWLCEAAAETYLPLVRILDELRREGLHPKLTVGLSPVLCEQLADTSFREELTAYLNQKIDAARADTAEFGRLEQPSMAANAERWERFYAETLKQFETIGGDILGQFRRLQDEGVVEIITCGATHGYLPLLLRDESVQVQVKAAVANYRRHFGCSPRGIWLPECAYRPRYEWTPPVPVHGSQERRPRKGVDEFLGENGLEFFIIDTPLLKGGKSIGVYIERFEALQMLWTEFQRQYQPPAEDTEKSPYRVYLVNSGGEEKRPVAIFTRDPQTGILVWSGEHGYPGDGHYLDFHKKRFPGGLRYWAVTASDCDLADKVEYHPESARERVAENSRHFAETVTGLLGDHYRKHGEPGILVAPYDAELFGHWWFEGPEFLKAVLRHICRSDEIECSFLSEHLERVRPTEVVAIPEGSWGEGNHHYIWLNRHTEWTWKHIYECEETMCRLARRWVESPSHLRQDTLLEEILLQLGRELMLLSASDWQFLISTWSARDYAELRLTEHYHDFTRLVALAEKRFAENELTPGEHEFLRECRQRDNLFPELQIDWFARVEYPL